MRDYDQLLSVLSEIFVIRQLVTSDAWPEERTFEWEPMAPESAKNPELLARLPDVRIGMEVKTPALDAYRMIRDRGGLKWSTQQCLQSSARSVVVEGLSGARVQSSCDLSKALLRETCHAGSFRQVLT